MQKRHFREIAKANNSLVGRSERRPGLASEAVAAASTTDVDGNESDDAPADAPPPPPPEKAAMRLARLLGALVCSAAGLLGCSAAASVVVLFCFVWVCNGRVRQRDGMQHCGHRHRHRAAVQEQSHILPQPLTSTDTHAHSPRTRQTQTQTLPAHITPRSASSSSSSSSTSTSSPAPPPPKAARFSAIVREGAGIACGVGFAPSDDPYHVTAR
eukprot:1453650-Rhodomonas_salina.1